MTLSHYQQMARENGIAQYRVAGLSLERNGYYQRCRCYGRPLDGGRPGYVDIYVIRDGHMDTLCYNTAPHRARQLLLAYQSGRLQYVAPAVVNNYATNGYTTRRGLFADYSTTLGKIEKIAQSHADYMGCEIDSTTDHNNRVAMRNV